MQRERYEIEILKCYNQVLFIKHHFDEQKLEERIPGLTK